MPQTPRFVPLSLLTLGLAVGCATAQKQPPPAATAEARKAPPPKPVATAGSDADDAAGGPSSFGPIYYSLDSAQLGPESTQMLNDLAAWLRSRPGAKVKIDGHTCELGTSEYNLALGTQRAAAAKRYLEALGVDPARIDTLSFGEERPAAPESPDRNRRSELTLLGAAGVR